MKLKIGRVFVEFGYISAVFMLLPLLLYNDSRYAAAILCVVCHELGHIEKMLSLGMNSVHIKVRLLDIAINDTCANSRSYLDDISVILAGPAANLLMCIICGVIYKYYPVDFLYNAFVISLVLFAFNMLPLESTDGGRLAEIILKSFFSERTVKLIIIVSSFIIIVPFAVFGLYILLCSRYNYSLLFSGLYITAAVIQRIINE